MAGWFDFDKRGQLLGRYGFVYNTLSGPVSGAIRATSMAISQLGNTLIGLGSNPATREGNYTSSAVAPNALPSLDEIIKLAYSRVITPAELAEFAACHGAQLGDHPLTVLQTTSGISRDVSEKRWRLWESVFVNNKPHLPTELLRKLSRQGVQFASTELDRALIRDGLGGIADRDMYVNEYENLSVSTLINLYLLGEYNHDDFLREMAILGYRPQDSELIARSIREVPNLSQTLNLYLLGKYTVSDVTYNLVRLGYDAADVPDLIASIEQLPSVQDSIKLWLLGINSELDVSQVLTSTGLTDQDNQDKVKLLRFPLPSAAELYLSGSRYSWDQSFADLWQLDAEMPPEVAAWAARLGINYSAGTDGFGSQDGANKTWAELAWRNHWSLPSVSTIFDIRRRVRGEPSDRSTWSIPTLAPLTDGQINQMLGQAGIAPGLRPYMSTLAYSPISIRHLRMIVSEMNPPLSYVQGVYQDNGYSPSDALLISQALIADVHKKDNAEVLALNKRAWARFVGAIEDSYSLGILDNATATAQLESNGIPSATVAIMLGTADAKVAQGIVRKVVTRAQSDVFSGRTTWGEALQRLIMAGVEPARAQQTVAGWQAEFGEGRRQVATSKILSLLRKGLLTKDQAVTRLDNIGWSKPDEVLLLAEVQLEVNKDRASALKTQDAQRAKQQGAMEKALKKTAATATALQKRLKALSPPKEIVQWYVDGVWSEKKAVDRLRLLGYPDEDIQAMLIEGLDKKKSSSKKKG